jgi:DNA adenine methylase
MQSSSIAVDTMARTIPIAVPYVKWAGGKRSMLRHLLPLVPTSFGTYHEPFVGGGALFFALRPSKAVISDINRRLVRSYVAVRDEVEAVITLLKTYPYEKEFFLKMRAVPIDDRSDVEVAAWLIYLNRTCFNGLYRVNRDNGFNVPFGRYANPTICDEANLRACSEALKGAAISHDPFEKVLERAVPGDFAYFDPPYLPISATSSFTGYSADGFGLRDHERLRDVARELKSRGVHVLLSNSAAPAIRELYAHGFEVTEVLANRAINANGEGRGKIPELIIR